MVLRRPHAFVIDEMRKHAKGRGPTKLNIKKGILANELVYY